ncbi:S-(hydroxymethyl)glutathione dehydrogenase / alcohol dehydrogenase [Sphingobium faniae]|nr:S-(hydroxymethyl)glutathione dehydrogenase / alcohol dehydrogenase [Sphingobium faniae]
MPVKTRAAVAFGPNRDLEIREVTLADPQAGQVMVRFLASGLCHSDLHVLEEKAAQQFPVILGHEGIAEVVALGEGVTEFALGDRVIPYLVPDCGKCAFCLSGRTNLCVEMQARRMAGWTPFSLDGEPVACFMAIGSFAEMSVIPVDMLVKVDRAARPDHACCIACGVTTGLGAALITAKVTPGSSVAVFGVGGVGLSVVQGAKLAGASRIIAIDTNAAKKEIAARLGATDFIDASASDNIVAEVQKLTGLGADFAFECVGIPELARQALEAVNPAWGMAVCVGVMPAGRELSTAPFLLMTGRRWTGSLMGGAKRQDVARFVDMYVAGEYALDDLVSHRLSLEDVNRGFTMMKSGEAVRSVVLYEQ